jgi:hypothetical protein
MWKAGVAPSEAVGFLSTPLIMEYEKRVTDLLGVSNFSGQEMTLSQASAIVRKQMISDLMPSLISVTNRGVSYIDQGLRTEYTHNIIDEGTMSMDDIKDALKGNEDKSLKMLMHYFDLEDQAQDFTQVKLALNLDTKRTVTAFEAMSKLEKIEEARNLKRIAPGTAQKILDNTVIGSFQVQDFQLQILEPLFQLRNHPAMIDLIKQLLASDTKINKKTFKGLLKEVFGDVGKGLSQFQNDFIDYMFASGLYSEMFKDGKFRSLEIKQELFAMADSYEKALDKNNKKLASKILKDAKAKGVPIEEVLLLQKGAFPSIMQEEQTMVLGDKIYFDENHLKTMYYNGNLSTKTIFGAANKFTVFPSYIAFKSYVFEREYIRSRMSIEEVSKLPLYDIFSEMLNNGIEPGTEQYKNNRLLAYEYVISDMALDNTYNPWKLFRSTRSYALQFEEIYNTHKKMFDANYRLFDYLVPDIKTSVTGKEVWGNLKLVTTGLQKEEYDLLHDELKALSDPSVIKSQNPVENMMISNFFKKLGVVGILQSGIGGKGVFNLSAITDLNEYTRRIIPTAKKFEGFLNLSDPSAGDVHPALVDFISKFKAKHFPNIQQEDSSDASSKQIEYIRNIDRKRIKNYVGKPNVDIEKDIADLKKEHFEKTGEKISNSRAMGIIESKMRDIELVSQKSKAETISLPKLTDEVTPANYVRSVMISIKEFLEDPKNKKKFLVINIAADDTIKPLSYEQGFILNTLPENLKTRIIGIAVQPVYGTPSKNFAGYLDVSVTDTETGNTSKTASEEFINNVDSAKTRIEELINKGLSPVFLETGYGNNLVNR